MMNIGIVGVGCISGIYLKNLHEVFHELRLVGVCDLIKERALKAQKEWNIPHIPGRNVPTFITVIPIVHQSAVRMRIRTVLSAVLSRRAPLYAIIAPIIYLTFNRL